MSEPCDVIRVHTVILRSQNKITDFLMILSWASPFKSNINKTVITAPMNTFDIKKNSSVKSCHVISKNSSKVK